MLALTKVEARAGKMMAELKPEIVASLAAAAAGGQA